MTHPKRIRLSRAKGWRLPSNTINVARPGKFGNPFVVGKDGTRSECVGLFAHLLAGMVPITSGDGLPDNINRRKYVMANLHRLRGMDLACWCALDGKTCHADVLLKLANNPLTLGMLDEFIMHPAIPVIPT
jgi:Domain of unknown function (DUF4326)